jgi:isopenicillin-N epimerase
MNWTDIRASVEHDPEITYLNTGTSGLIPKAVHQATMQWREKLHHNPTDYVWRAMADELWKSRARLATHLESSPEQLVFFSNISQAINTFCLSVDLPQGSDILLSDHEYGAMRWAWERASQIRGWNIVPFSLPIETEDSQEIVAAVERSITSNTKLLFLSHILYSTGLVLPIEDICARARSRDIVTFIDGAHAPGMLPLDLSTMNADFYAANLHKWFLTPVGAAFLYCDPRSKHHLRPWQVSWGFSEGELSATERNEFGSTPWIRQFEMEGTRDLTSWFVVSQSCDFVESLGYPAIRARHFELSSFIREALSGLGGFQLCTPNHPQLRGGLTSFRLPANVDGQKLRNDLWQKDKIEINVIDLGGCQHFRVSTHVYNTMEEIEKLAKSLRSMLL